MENGLGKKSSISNFPKQGRGGQGVKVAQITTKTGKVAAAQMISANSEELIITSKKGQIVKIDIASIPSLSRATQGVILMRFSNPNDHVASATCIEN
jgi:DNA gyrase subunit A